MPYLCPQCSKDDLVQKVNEIVESVRCLPALAFVALML